MERICVEADFGDWLYEFIPYRERRPREPVPYSKNRIFVRYIGEKIWIGNERSRDTSNTVWKQNPKSFSVRSDYLYCKW